jgi:hypothetical protein
MKNRAVRLFAVSICCLAIPLVASAAQDNNKKKKTQGQQQQAQRPAQPGGKHQNAGKQNTTASTGTVAKTRPSSKQRASSKPAGRPAAWNEHGTTPQGQHERKPQNAGNQNMMNKGRQGFNNPKKAKNANMANQGNQGWKKGNQGLNKPNNPNKPKNPNIANKGKNLPNNPNKVAGGQANKAKWQTKHYDNIAKGPSRSIKSVTYQRNYKINGAANWQGAHYAAFRDYHAEWHDHAWWHNHYGRNLVLIGGGWYFLNPLGFWAPAWGYNPAQAYYPYNGPIYAYRNLPPDQVIANVQASLQEQGYYTGEVDGLLGPLTQEALVNFQNANDLAPTGSIDEPTLDALGMS